MRGVSIVLSGMLCVVGGCTATGGEGPGDPPPAIHPAELFPAPPGFAASADGPSRWRFTGRGAAAEAADFYRTSCVQLFDWSPVDERRDDDGSWTLRYRRPEARLSVHVGESNDRLEILITLERKRGEATDPAGRPDGRTDR